MVKKEKTDKSARSNCPVAGTLDIIGDRWTLLVVRDLLKGKKRFGEFIESAEKIPTNILTDRLKMLENSGLIEKVWYSERPPRAEYLLSAEGRELGKIVKEIRDWGNRHLHQKSSQ